jgi:hypothetical protein
LRVVVTASNSAGSASATSAATGVVALTVTSSSSSSVCSAGSLAACPASYFTGPLGSRNLLPAKPGAFLIDEYGGYGTSWDQTKAGILQRQQDMGRGFDGIHVHYGGDGSYLGIANCIASDRVSARPPDWIHGLGAFPVVTWMPNRTIADVNAGLVDPCFRAVADHFKSFGFPVMLRIWNEFDLSFVTWHACGQSFIDAWRRVVGIFRQQGATNVGFWWTPEEGVDRTCVNNSYPGDAYVDWVGSDSYNTCYVGEGGCWSTPYHSGWAAFAELFNYQGLSFKSQHDLWGPRKPFVVGETNTVYDPNNPNRKGDWYGAIPAAAQSMPYLRGISFYDQDVSAVEGPRNNYRVDYPTSNPNVYSGFKKMAAHPWFNTR